MLLRRLQIRRISNGYIERLLYYIITVTMKKLGR